MIRSRDARSMRVEFRSPWGHTGVSALVVLFAIWVLFDAAYLMAGLHQDGPSLSGRTLLWFNAVLLALLVACGAVVLFGREGLTVDGSSRMLRHWSGPPLLRRRGEVPFGRVRRVELRRELPSHPARRSGRDEVSFVVSFLLTGDEEVATGEMWLPSLEDAMERARHAAAVLDVELHNRLEISPS